MSAKWLEQLQTRTLKKPKKCLLTDTSTTEEKVKAFINWYGYKKPVWKLQAEEYNKGENTNKLQGAQGDQEKQGISLELKVQGFLI